MQINIRRRYCVTRNESLTELPTDCRRVTFTESGFGDIETPPSKDILLNLSPTIPAYHNRFRRIFEIVTQDEAMKAHLREHYRYYKQADYGINTHKL